MTTTLHQDLSRAAILLEEFAHELKRSNAVGNRQWVAAPEYKDEVAKDRADHDEMLRLAGVLRRYAAYLYLSTRV